MTLKDKLIQSIKTTINGVAILAITLSIRGLRPLKRGVPVDGFAMASSTEKLCFVPSNLNSNLMSLHKMKCKVVTFACPVLMGKKVLSSGSDVIRP